MIFNSLGSNYSLSFALKALFAKGSEQDTNALLELLEKRYGGKATLLYKAREAITLALKFSNLPQGSFVAVNGYTCYAVYRGIIDAGMKVEYLDVPDRKMDFTADELKKALSNNPEIKAVILQNTLGFVCDIEAINAVCQEHSLFLIEDLAHAVGAKYKNGSEAGTVGDFTVLSFSQDKTVDAVSGGALVARNKMYQSAQGINLQDITKRQQSVDRWYPILTYKIRKTYSFGLGKAIHYILKKLNWLSLGLADVNKIVLHKLPDWYSKLILKRFYTLDSELAHRREIAKVYASKLNDGLLVKDLQIENSSALRFPILVKERGQLIEHLKSFSIHVSDIWYDAPVAPKKFMHLSDYSGQCPNAQKISDLMLNLPTHREVSVEQAEEIVKIINQWLHR